MTFTNEEMKMMLVEAAMAGYMHYMVALLDYLLLQVHL